MYQVIVYDDSGRVPRVMNQEDFSNEECAWAWYDMKLEEKNRARKRLKLEFKYLGNTAG